VHRFAGSAGPASVQSHALPQALIGRLVIHAENLARPPGIIHWVRDPWPAPCGIGRGCQYLGSGPPRGSSRSSAIPS
jgi:hypothetical protein